jgi:hypothetical protein
MMMIEKRGRGLKLLMILVGIAVPLGSAWFWRKGFACRHRSEREKRDQLQEIAVEDSFPASDPPASW